MAAGRIKGITIEIGGDTTKLTKALSSVDTAISKAKQNLRDLDKALKLDPTNVTLIKDRQLELGKEIENTENKVKKEKAALEELNQKLDQPWDIDHAAEFEANARAAENLKLQIDLDEAELKQLKEEAKNTASVMGTVFQAAGEKIAEVGNKIKGVGENISSVGQSLTTQVTVPIAAAFGASAKAAVDWESAFTGVMKTVDETANTTYDDLKNTINEIAETTASSQNEIASVMEIGGQLGVTADDIGEFTKNVVMLKDTTNLSLEDAATSIAKFSNVTGMAITDSDRLGSVIVDLGNNYATTEADIMSMAQRLSGAGSQIGLSEGEILGFATALSSVGIEAEMGGSAFSKAMIKMQVAAETGYDQVIDLQNRTGMSLRELELLSSNNSKDFKALADSLGMTKEEMNATIKAGSNLQDFAEVANMDTKEFVELYRNDAPAALQEFIKGLGDTEGHGETTIAMLQEMGFTEVRLRDTLTRLANSGDLVTDAVAQGNQAWSENSAMTIEAEKRYATMESKISQLKARITEIAVEIGEMLMPYIQKLMDFVQGLIDKWNGLDESQKELIIQIAAIAAAVGPILLIIGNVIIGIGSLITAIGTISSAIGVLIPILMGPVGIIAAIVAAIVALGVVIYKNWDDIVAWAQGIMISIQEMATGVMFKILELKEDLIAKWEELKITVVTKVTELKTNVINKFIELKTNVQNKIIELKNSLTELWNNIKTFLQTTVENIKTNITTAFTNIKDKITEKITGAKDAIIDGMQAACDFISELPGKFLDWGSEMIQGLIDGIRSKISAVGDAVKSVADAIAGYIHFSEPDVGPLSNFHTFMPDMIKEMVQGINQGLPQLENAMSGMASTLVPSAGQLSAGSSSVSNTVTINVYGAQGQDVSELADIIQDRINQAVYSQEAVFA